MASACVNNSIGMPPENFLDCPATLPTYGWLNPRVSFTREVSDVESSKVAGGRPSDPAWPGKEKVDTKATDLDVTGKDVGDFEFRPVDPVTMPSADELFSDGKLMPLQISTARSAVPPLVSLEVRQPQTAKVSRRSEVSDIDPYLFSPKAPTCSIRWKNILRLKKLQINNNGKQGNQHKTTSSSPSHTSRSLIKILNRSSKYSTSNSCTDSSLPLLKDSDSESVSSSSRLSLSSSSSSGHEHDDLPKLPPSLNSEKPNRNRSGSSEGRSSMVGALADSPRLNSSGKVVFQGLERSSSSPSSFNGGPRYKHSGIERSYSAHVRVTPVLNVPVCSLRGSSKFGFPLFSSSLQKREGSNGGGNRFQRRNSKSRKDQA